MSADDRKAIALDFLDYARTGNRDAAERLAAPGARHHNPLFAAGMPALLDAVVEAAKEAPARQLDVKRVIAEGDCVVVHSHVRHRRGDPGMSLVHIFRFEDDRIAEVWDIAQPLPEVSPNADGAF